MSLESITQQVKEEISRLNEVLHLLEGGTKPAKSMGQVRQRRKMSAAGRKRIGDAQRARWARVRAGKK